MLSDRQYIGFGKGRNMQQKTAVTEMLCENIAQMEELFRDCADIKKKEFRLGKHMDVPCYLTFIEVSVDMGTSAIGELLKFFNQLEKKKFIVY